MPTIGGYQLHRMAAIIAGIVVPCLGAAPMSDVTRVLSAIEQGDPSAAEQLLPLVYDELRKLAASNMSREKPGQTLDATALVHEAYIRLVDPDRGRHWESRRHFFCAAAQAMRRILVENARRKHSLRHGGSLARKDIEDCNLAAPEPDEDLSALDEAIDKLARTDREAAELIALRYFAGLTSEQAAEVLGISPRTADRAWAYGRAWLRKELAGS